MSGQAGTTRRGGILIVTDRRFWRRSIGSEQRIATLVLHLARRPEGVTVAYVGRLPRSERARLTDFLRSSPGLEVVPRRATPTALAHGLRRAVSRPFARIGSGRRPAAGTRDRTDGPSPARRDLVQSLIRQRAPRIVIVEFLRLTYTVIPRDGQPGPDPHLLIDTHDLLHRRAERARLHGAAVDHPIDAAQEMSLLGDYDAAMAIQRLEAALLREGLPGQPVLVVPHGLAAPPAADRPIAAARPIRIGFLGGRDASNRDALDWFVREVWPELRRKFQTDVEFHVAGEVTAAWTSVADGVRILGPVDSIEDFWCAIDIAINPVRFGSGLKIKNVEALAYGRALLTTSIGAEGLEAAGPAGLRIADSVGDWTNVLTEWLANPDLAVEIARHGRAFAESHLNERAVFAELDGYLDARSGEELGDGSGRESGLARAADPGWKRVMKPANRGDLFLVLASQPAFEAFVGPVPGTLRDRFRFLKPGRAARIRALLPDCRLVITKSFRRPEVNRWVFEARRLGVPTLLLVDGPLEWANLYRNPSLASLRADGVVRGLFEPIVHDAVATIGAAQSDWIAQRNRGRGIEFMSYANRRIRTATGERAKTAHAAEATEATDAANASDADRAFDFLVTTAKTPCFDEDERIALRATLSACGRALEAAGHRVLVRIFDDDLRDILRSAAPSSTCETEGSFADALARTRCVLGTPSSVILEAMLHDRPTALLMYRDSPLFYQTGWLLGCRADWAESFRSMLERDPERMALQRETLRTNVSDQDFFDHCEAIASRDRLPTPRALDAEDLAFENQVLHRVFGWRARWLGGLLRAVSASPPKGR